MRVTLTIEGGQTTETYTVDRPSATMALPLLAAVMTSALSTRERELDTVRWVVAALGRMLSSANPDEVTVTQSSGGEDGGGRR